MYRMGTKVTQRIPQTSRKAVDAKKLRGVSCRVGVQASFCMKITWFTSKLSLSNQENSPTSLQSSLQSKKTAKANKVCLGPAPFLRHDITRGHPIAPACVRWRGLKSAAFGLISRVVASGLESPQIDRHPVSPTALFAGRYAPQTRERRVYSSS